MNKAVSGIKEMTMVESVQDIVSQNLDKVEAQIDSTVDNAKNAVHAMRSQAQQAVDRTLIRFTEFWERFQKQVETQMDQRPWVVLGSLLVVGYLLTRSRSRGE